MHTKLWGPLLVGDVFVGSATLAALAFVLIVAMRFG